MKRISSFLVKSCFLFLCFPFQGLAQTVTVDGNIFLQGETSHDGIMVAFERVAPTTLFDTAYTNVAGYYEAAIESGVWKFAYHKTGFSSKYFDDTPIYSEVTIADTLMERAIEGAIKDTLYAGTYLVTNDLLVNGGDTLVIEAGTSLKFANGSKLIATGLLLVNGEENKRVIFDWDAEGNYWKGLRLQGGGLKYRIAYADVKHTNYCGIELRSTTLEISHSLILDNTAPNEYLGGISVYRSNAIINHCDFRSNLWGAIYCSDGSFKLNACSFVENRGGDGGAIRTSGATIDIVNCLFANNTASRGGAMFPGYAKTRIRNSYFIDNKPDAIYAPSTYDSQLKIYNSLFINSDKGITSAHAYVELKNNLFWNNGAEGKDLVTTYRPQYIEWFADLVTTNINGDSIDAYGNLFLDPYLVDVPGGDYHATDSSRVVNAGPLDTTGLNLPDSDIEGMQRIYGGVVDIGPFEYTGCTVSAGVKVSQVSCNGMNDGMAVAVINSGVPPFSLSWNTGETTDTIRDLSPGIYQLTVTDSKDCSSIREFTISEPDSLLIEMQIFAASCGESNGSAVAFPSGGTLPYSYTWNGDQGNFGLTGIRSGEYTLLVSDKNDCRTDTLFVVPGPDSLKVSVHKQDLTCFGSDDGFVALHPSGGVAPFQVQWDHGVTGDSIYGLEPGVYNYTVTDINLCSSGGSILVNEPLEIKLATDVQDATCGTSDGKATVVVYQGGVAPFGYMWENGDIDATADSLSAGTYEVTVNDSHGCNAVSTAAVSDINAPEIIVDSIGHVSCHGLEDGTIAISVNTGVQPYQYLWSTSETTEDIAGLPAGSYTLSVTDINLCKDVEIIEVKQPDKLGAFLAVEHTQCGFSDGVISANVVGGTEPYFFDWSGGGDKAIEFDLSSGTYQVLISDANGCHIEKEESVEDRNGPVIEVGSIVSSGCNDTDGSAAVEVGGGLAPFSYEWSNGETTQVGSVGMLPSGAYDVRVIDAGGCMDSATFIVDTRKPDAPGICVVTVDSLTGTNLIVWDKLSVPGIEKYRIYKERYIAGSFELTGEVEAGMAGDYNDEFASPMQRSWKYKVSAVDECGNESEMSNYHETMHLTINASVNKDVNLIWNSYGGFATSTYYIHRYARNTGWVLLDSVPVSMFENKYTDFSPPPAHLTYFISYLIPGGACGTPGRKSTNGFITRSISNMQVSEYDAVGVDEELSSEGISVYPNPFVGNFFLELELSGNADPRIKVYNSLGSTVSVIEPGILTPGTHTLDMHIPGPSGLYLLEVTLGERVEVRRILKGE